MESVHLGARGTCDTGRVWAALLVARVAGRRELRGGRGCVLRGEGWWRAWPSRQKPYSFSGDFDIAPPNGPPPSLSVTIFRFFLTHPPSLSRQSLTIEQVPRRLLRGERSPALASGHVNTPKLLRRATVVFGPTKPEYSVL